MTKVVKSKVVTQMGWEVREGIKGGSTEVL